VSEVLASGKLAQGEKVAEFESRFAKVAGADHAVAVANGTLALSLALRVLKPRGGKAVQTTSFSFVATAATIVENGMEPSFTDILPDTYNLDPAWLKAPGDGRACGVMPVHLYGLPADMDAIQAAAEKRGLFVLEDAAQAIGATYKGRRVGSIGDAACFSLYATKNITTGEGGMITTNNPTVAERLRILRHQGQAAQYEYVEVGTNARMTEIQGAIGIEQLRRLRGLNAKRGQNARRLTAGLRSLPSVIVPSVPADMTHVWHQYTVRVPPAARVQLRAFLSRKGIDTGVYYPQALHELPIFGAYKAARLPQSELAARSVLSLPVHPGVTGLDCDRVTGAIREFFESRSRRGK